MSNFDLKLIKSLATTVKNLFSNLIDSRQTAYVNERFIGESSRLLNDVIKACDIQKISSYLLTVDFEKVFDSVNHKFLLKNTVLIRILLTGSKFYYRTKNPA